MNKTIEVNLRIRARLARRFSWLALISAFLCSILLFCFLSANWRHYLFNDIKYASGGAGRGYNFNLSTQNEDVGVAVGEPDKFNGGFLSDNVVVWRISIDFILCLLAIVLVFYVLSVLVRFSKYYARMATHYESVADTLVLVDSDVSKIEPVYNVVSGGKVLFGPEESPALKDLEKIAEVLKKLK